MNDPIGVIHGRFQLLHLGHMEYLLAGKARCRRLIVGVSNPDATVTRFSSASPHRSQPSSNPLTYFERYEMLRGSLLEAGVPREEFDIVPFPVNCPELLFNYVPREAKFYMTLYDQWSLEKKALLESLGITHLKAVMGPSFGGMSSWQWAVAYPDWRSCGGAPTPRDSPAARRSGHSSAPGPPGPIWCPPSSMNT